MNIILVKHHTSDRVFCFKLSPLKAKLAKKGDLLLVDTRFGQKLATAVSNPMKIDDNLRGVVEAFGATFPLKPVLSVATKEMQEYIKNQEINNLEDKILSLFAKNDMPY